MDKVIILSKGRQNYHSLIGASYHRVGRKGPELNDSHLISLLTSLSEFPRSSAYATQMTEKPPEDPTDGSRFDYVSVSQKAPMHHRRSN